MNAIFKKVTLVLLVFFGLNACSADPTANDLRSPCVSSNASDNAVMVPCERRKLLENYVA